MLRDDIEHYETAYGQQPSGQNRRGLFRALMVYVEGMTQGMKLYTLEFGLLYRLRMDAGAVAVLREVAFDVDDNGAIRETPKFVPIARSIRVMFRLWGEIFEFDPETDFADVGWRDLQAAIRIRNALTHPRRSADLEVSAEQLAQARNGVRWFDREWQRAGDAHDRALAAQKAAREKAEEARRAAFEEENRRLKAKYENWSLDDEE